MLRRQFLKTSGIGLASLALINNSVFAALLKAYDYKLRMLTKDIGIFSEKGGTILFLINKGGVLVVDAQFPDTASHLIEEIRKKTDKPFELLINTHHHYDHTAGNIAFKGLVKNVLAHGNSKINQQNAAIKNKTEDKQLYPNQTFGSVWCQPFGKEKICLRYFGAAHTNGDSFVQFKKAGIVHVGDLVFNRMHPYIDRSSGASIKGWIDVLEKAAAEFKPKTTYVCGHAGNGFDIVIKKEDMLAFRSYLINLMAYVGDQIKNNISLDKLIADTKAIPGSPEWQGDGIERPLKAAYQELMEK